jgi:hypothetical protein
MSKKKPYTDKMKKEWRLGDGGGATLGMHHKDLFGGDTGPKDQSTYPIDALFD